MRRFIWLPLAGFLLIAGATVGAAAPSIFSGENNPLSAPLERATTWLQEVLDDLVGQGVINEDQSQAILGAVDQRIEQRQAEISERHAQMEQTREQIRGFLEDGVITAEELAQLPAEHPLRNLDSVLEDGQITLEELRELGGWAGRGPGRGHGGWGRHGGPGWMLPPATDDSGSEDGSATTS
jgi:polyhydroxyalkanoate synthesis regulator phasin